MAYFGFTQREVEALCRRYDENPDLIGDWYDGYFMYASSKGEKPERGETYANGSGRFVDEKPSQLWHIYKETLIKAFPLCQIAARSAFLCDLCTWFLWKYD